MRKYSTAQYRLFTGLFVLGMIILYFYHLGSYHLIDPDEGRYHEIAWEMVQSHNFITPTLDGVKYFEKPALQYWITAILMMIFGKTEFVGRIVPALSGLGCVFLAYKLGAMIYTRRIGLLAAAILGTCCLNLIVSSINILDMLLTFCLGATMTFFYAYDKYAHKKYLLGFYVFMGLGVLAKGLIAIILPFGILFWYYLLTKQFRHFFSLFYLPGIILFGIVTVPWFYLVCSANPDFFYFFFIHEHFLRFTTKIHHRFQPWWFFLPFIVAGLIPWAGFITGLFTKKGVIRITTSKRNKQDIIFLVTYFLVILVFFSISDSKLVPYIMPCFLPLSILIAANFKRCEIEKRWLGHGLFLNSLIAIIFAIALIVFAFKSSYMQNHLVLDATIILTLGLFLVPIVSYLAYYKTKEIRCTATALFIVAYIIGIGFHQVQEAVHDSQSSYYVSQEIIKLNPQHDLIMSYGDYFHGINFYTGERIAVANFKGELEFGLDKPAGKGYYFTTNQMLELWKSPKRIIIVMKPSKLKQDEKKIMKELKSTAATTANVGDYIIVINHN